jgi:hypothetical protein
VGEQSNAYRILLRYDRKSRHRRIKKQRRYERLAATSQFRDTQSDVRTDASTPPSFPPDTLGVDWAPSRVGVARTLSPRREAPNPHSSER